MAVTAAAVSAERAGEAERVAATAEGPAVDLVPVAAVAQLVALEVPVAASAAPVAAVVRAGHTE